MFRKLGARNRADAIVRAPAPRRPPLAAASRPAVTNRRAPRTSRSTTVPERTRGAHTRSPSAPSPSWRSSPSSPAARRRRQRPGQPRPAPQRTLVAAGIGTIKVTPKDAKDNDSIKAAVADATAKALPAAIQDAARRPAKLASGRGRDARPAVSLSNEAQPYARRASSTARSTVDRLVRPGPVLRDRPDALRATIDKDGKRHYGKAQGPPRLPRAVGRPARRRS